MRKLTRAAFGYLDPSGPNQDQFAQCATCSAFLPGRQLCAYFANRKHVVAGGTSILYTPGQPSDRQSIIGTIYASDAGYEVRQVRCENCYFGSNGKCGLYHQLNAEFPGLFDLDQKIHPKGCCNFNTPKE